MPGFMTTFICALFIYFPHWVLGITLIARGWSQRCSPREDSLLGADHCRHFNPLEQFFNIVYTRDFLVQILFTHIRITQEGTCHL